MIKRLFRQMSGTQILSALSTTLCLLIDSIVVGRLLGVESMSAYGLASPFLIMLCAIGTMSTVGVQVVCGKAIGAGNRKECSAAYSTSVAMALVISLCAILLIFSLWRPICTFLGAGQPLPDNQVFFMTGDYLKGYIVGAPFFLLSQIMAPYLQISGKRRVLTVSVVAMMVTNIAADLLSVFVFHAGLFGIGLASSLGYLAAVCAGAVFFLKKDCPFHFHFDGINMRVLMEIFKAGSPVIINQLCYTVRIFLMNQMLLRLSGTAAVAVFAAVSSLGNLFFSVGLGSGAVALMLSAIFCSEEDRTSLLALMRIMVRHTLLMMTAVVLAAVVFAPFLAKLFLGSAPDVLALSVPALRIYMISLIPCALVVIFKNYYQGTMHTLYIHVLSFIDALVFPALFAWIGGRLFGINGVWMGIIAGEVAVCCVILMVAWIRERTVSFSAETLSLLPRRFGESKGACFDMTIEDAQSAVDVSRKIHAFCKEQGADARTSYYVGLSVEEMTINIINHGFSKDALPHNIDVHLVLGDTDRLLRIRDNCIRFDPISYLDLQRSDDPAAHIGIRMVMRTVKDANYIHSLGLNNLTLRF